MKLQQKLRQNSIPGKYGPKARRRLVRRAGVKRRIFAARSRRVPSTETEVLNVSAVLQFVDVKPARLVISSVKIPSIIGPAMMVGCPRLPFQTPAASSALVLGKHGRGYGRGKNNGST
jgi:hypothetical protein